MTHILDRPVWSALETRHAAFAEGGKLAKRYPPSIIPFAATQDDAPESLRELSGLATPGEGLLIAQADPIVLPPGCVATFAADFVQMIAEQPLPQLEEPRVEPLGDADAQAMLDLAMLTKPGPFTLRALSLGRFWGVKRDGALIAMAGERMKQPGYTELSGVCVHTELRRGGLGRLLLRFVAGEIFARGDQPYLHAIATNTSAIALYESVGFRLRSRMHVSAIQPA
jgi:ribosomal protein S18 acetylase RimI-like enzyme